MFHEQTRPVTIRVGRLADTSQAAAILDKSERTLARLSEAGYLSPVIIRGRKYYSLREIVELATDWEAHGLSSGLYRVERGEEREPRQ
jgi:hypothetical protein